MNVTGSWICSISQNACVKYGCSSVFRADVQCSQLLSLCVIDVFQHSKVTWPPRLVMSRPYTYVPDMYYVLGVLSLIVRSASDHSSVCPALLILSLSVSDKHTHKTQESNLNLGPRPLGG